MDGCGILLYTYARTHVHGGRDGRVGDAGHGEWDGGIEEKEEKNVFIRMVECHAGLEIAPYISSAMRRETLFSTSQKPRTGPVAGTAEERATRHHHRRFPRLFDPN